jgi:FtsH-binding integral membrane protein
MPYKNVLDKLSWFFETTLNFVGALVFTGVAYLAEIKGSIHIMWLVMIADLFVGIWKSKRVNKERINLKKIKYWVEFVLINTMVVALTYGIEKEMIGVSPRYYNGFTILITGFTLTSILRNAELLTEKYIFTILIDLTNDKIKAWIGIDLRKYKTERDEQNNRNSN